MYTHPASCASLEWGGERGNNNAQGRNKQDCFPDARRVAFVFVLKQAKTSPPHPHPCVRALESLAKWTCHNRSNEWLLRLSPSPLCINYFIHLSGVWPAVIAQAIPHACVCVRAREKESLLCHQTRVSLMAMASPFANTWSAIGPLDIPVFTLANRFLRSVFRKLPFGLSWRIF